uniref:Tripartite motif-containing protein 16-like n=1 Tax=Paramormyrops kingsleyae TaxID=1676925 RepID=A0A3B3RLG0_9TELE
MAELGYLLDLDQFNCPICLDLLKDPVAPSCGHSYCMSCIKGHWDQEDYFGVYSCPQCRQTFTPRPILGRNTILAEVVEKLKKTGLQAATPVDYYAGPGDVECDVCTGRKRKAVKTCLVCLASYCETDLQLHNKLNQGKQHKLIDAIGRLQDKVCSQHDKLLEVYCRTDQQCICLLCVMDEHRGHDTVSAAAGRTEKEKELKTMQKESKKRVKEKDKELQELRQASSAQSAVEDSERIFAEMIRSIERRRSEVIQLIRDQEKAVVSQAEQILKRLEQEIEEFKRRNTELKEFSHTEDHILFLQVCMQLYSSAFICMSSSEYMSKVAFNPYCSFADVGKEVSVLQDQLEYLLKEDLLKNSGLLRKHYACELTLDPSTLQRQLCLSEGNRVVTWVEDCQPYPDHPERFGFHQQVLCREGLTGCCYWEAEWSGTIGVYIAVSYKGIGRKGTADLFGRNDKSWSLFCSPTSYFFRHNDHKTGVHGPISSRIGVYLNFWTGTLSFYSISDTMTLLHRVQTTFTEPLYPGFYICRTGTAVKLCSLRNESTYRVTD